MISWLIATNHCAFGLMKPTARAGAVHAHCHGGKSAPGEETPVDGMRECCKSIHGAPVPENVEAKFDATKSQLQLFALLQLLVPEISERALSSFVFDHGPPRAVSFAESVLQRSLLSHAPPFAV
jgi:hypothetical protein